MYFVLFLLKNIIARFFYLSILRIIKIWHTRPGVLAGISFYRLSVLVLAPETGGRLYVRRSFHLFFLCRLFLNFSNDYRTRQNIIPRGLPRPLLISPCPARVLPTASDGPRQKMIALQRVDLLHQSPRAVLLHLHQSPRAVVLW